MAVTRFFGIPEYYPWLQKSRVRLDYQILDVGCGMGRLLAAFRREGFRKLTGVDPFIQRDITDGSGIRLLKRELAEVDEQFDFILLHHSFEHMPDPHQVFAHLNRLLLPDRFVFLRIPVGGCWAWKHYGEHWVQLDAPRHFFLHTSKSIEILAQAAGFEVAAVEYDSTEFQIVGSEHYVQGLDPASRQAATITPEQLAEYRAQAADLNRRGEGDQACFYLYKRG
jgi:SAM-dependent methyltransferase